MSQTRHQGYFTLSFHSSRVQIKANLIKLIFKELGKLIIKSLYFFQLSFSSILWKNQYTVQKIVAGKCNGDTGIRKGWKTPIFMFKPVFHKGFLHLHSTLYLSASFTQLSCKLKCPGALPEGRGRLQSIMSMALVYPPFITMAKLQLFTIFPLL